MMAAWRNITSFKTLILQRVNPFRITGKPSYAALLAFLALPLAAAPEVLVMLGAPGTDAYEKKYATWVKSWESACSKGGAEYTVISKSADGKQPRELLQAWISGRNSGDAPLWLVFIGHGTFDGKNAKFNLQGPDITASELAGWLKPVERPIVVLNTASSSAPFISALSGENRVVVTSTRSGNEQNFARFGEFFSQNIGSIQADLDKDGQTSLLEAFIVTSRQVADFYKKEGRLATEHPLIDDNGDRLGTPPDWFRGIRPIKKPAEGSPDGYRAHQFHLVLGDLEKLIPENLRRQRDELEMEVYRLRDRKADLPQVEYYRQLEGLLRKIGKIYEQAESP